MAKLKLGPLLDDKPVKLTIKIPAELHRELSLYGHALGQATGGEAIDPVKLIAPMLSRFIASDREFSRLRRSATSPS